MNVLCLSVAAQHWLKSSSSHREWLSRLWRAQHETRTQKIIRMDLMTALLESRMQHKLSQKKASRNSVEFQVSDAVKYKWKQSSLAPMYFVGGKLIEPIREGDWIPTTP